MQQAKSVKRQKRHYLRDWSVAAGFAPKVLIDATGADKSTVSRWLDGAEPSADYLDALGKLFGVPAAALYQPPKALREVTYDPRDPAEPDSIDPDRHDTVGEYTPSNLPDGASPQLDVTGGMGAGGFILTAEGVPGVAGMTFAAEHISGFWQLPNQVQAALAIRAKDTVIIPVQGNSMSPTLIEGDFVFVDTRHRWPSPDGVYALADDFGGIIVKTLRLADSDQEGPHIEIVSDNPDKDRYPPKLRRAEDLRIIGRVVRRFSAVF
jgi:transcriptional regulator with XRE-family HTH domain